MFRNDKKIQQPSTAQNVQAPRKKILAVSGGIDSMAMLHLFKDDESVIVAHFNHGTRPSADADNLFCRRQAAIFRRQFYSAKTDLGPNPPEEKARTARYAFLNQLATDLDGEIYTAHHLDDLVETVAINLLRGTGWRGLTPLTLHRHPLLDKKWDKSAILRYAAIHSIPFRQDPTNTEDHYLRNRLRQSLYAGTASDLKQNMFLLWTKQKSIRRQIENLSTEILPPTTKTLPKELFISNPKDVALELLHYALKSQSISLTRPALQDFLTAINTYTSGKKFNLPHSKHAIITRATIILP